MENLWQDLRHGFRALRKSPGFTAVAVLTLGLGIGANTAIFSVVENVLLRPLPYRDPSALVQIWNTYLPQFPQVPNSPGDFQDFRRQTSSFSEIAAFVDIPQGFNLTGEGEPQRLEARYATSGLFPLLGVQPVAGRTFAPEEDKPGAAHVVMLSHRLWQSRFGSDPAVVGRMLMLDGRGYTLAGVLPATFRLAPTTDIWMPVGQYGDDLTSHLHHEFNIVARLKPGADISLAQAELTTLNRQEEQAFPDTHKNWGVLITPMEDPSAVKMRVALLILFGAVGLVLLVACANIVNLLLARNAVRQKEIALRVALGASRARLLGQLLTESILLSLLGGAGNISRLDRASRARRVRSFRTCQRKRNGAQRLGAGLHACRQFSRRDRMRTDSCGANPATRPARHLERRNANSRCGRRAIDPQRISCLGNCTRADPAGRGGLADSQLSSLAGSRSRVSAQSHFGDGGGPTAIADR